MPTRLSCACVLVRAADHDVAGRCRPFAQISQRPRNPVIAPVTVLPRHANDQLLNFSLDPRPAGASTSFRAIEFAGNEVAVPGQDGVRPGEACGASACCCLEPPTPILTWALFSEVCGTWD